MRRIAGFAAAFVAVVFLTGGHCGNEITAPLATPTPIPTVTPTPPPASLSGGVIVKLNPPITNLPIIRPVSGATVQVSQIGIAKTTSTDAEGNFTFSGLVAGPAHVTLSNTPYGNGDFKDVVLAPGPNQLVFSLGPFGGR